MVSNSLLSFFIPIFALMVGSFLTVVVYRLPREIPLGLFKNLRSVCNNCQSIIPYFRNIPIFSYLFLKGRSKCCNKKISSQYLVIEVTTFIILSLSFFLWHKHHQIVTYQLLIEYGVHFVFIAMLIAASFIDLNFRIIPNRINLGGWLLAICVSFFWGFTTYQSAILGGLLGFGMFFLLSYLYEKIKKIEGLGMGDVKMMGWLGSWLGIEYLVYVILIGSISGLVFGLIAMVKSKQGLKTAIPFGPFLAFGAFIAWILKINQIIL